MYFSPFPVINTLHPYTVSHGLNWCISPFPHCNQYTPSLRSLTWSISPLSLSSIHSILTQSHLKHFSPSPVINTLHPYTVSPEAFLPFPCHQYIPSLHSLTWSISPLSLSSIHPILTQSHLKHFSPFPVINTPHPYTVSPEAFLPFPCHQYIPSLHSLTWSISPISLSSIHPILTQSHLKYFSPFTVINTPHPYTVSPEAFLPFPCHQYTPSLHSLTWSTSPISLSSIHSILTQFHMVSTDAFLPFHCHQHTPPLHSFTWYSPTVNFTLPASILPLWGGREADEGLGLLAKDVAARSEGRGSSSEKSLNIGDAVGSSETVRLNRCAATEGTFVNCSTLGISASSPSFGESPRISPPRKKPTC